MLAKVKSGALLGVDAYIVEVEVDLAPGLPTHHRGPARDRGQGEQGPGQGRSEELRLQVPRQPRHDYFNLINTFASCWLLSITN